MNKTPPERRLAENEVYFRERNKRIQDGFDEINQIASDQGDDPHTYNQTTPIHFYCECSDETCTQRIKISMDEYNTIHKNNKAFVIVPGHEVVEYEHVVSKNRSYYVVEKYVNPPSTATKLNPTDLTNQ